MSEGVQSGQLRLHLHQAIVDGRLVLKLCWIDCEICFDKQWTEYRQARLWWWETSRDACVVVCSVW